MEKPRNISSQSSSTEGIDFNKLSIIVRHNWIWFAVIFIVINAAAYLALRYTKNIYESEAVLKLDVKNDATELGITAMVEDQNLNLISGEIEIIRSKLFLSRVLDSTGIDVRFLGIGRVLNDELYNNQPVFVQYVIRNSGAYNVPIFYDPDGENTFTIRFGNEGSEITGKYGEQISLGPVDVMLRKNVHFKRGDEIGYSFTINSREVLLDYLFRNLTAEPLNYSANTVRISFKDNNPFKAQSIVNKIDTIYLHYSNEQKSLANTQKIEWLSNELHQIERKMEDYENYFEDFTLQNKTNDLNEDLRKTIININRIDSQRYDVTRRINEVNRLIDGVNAGEFYISVSQRQLLPDFLTKSLDDLRRLFQEQEKLKLSYSEITFAFREKQKEIETLAQQSGKQLSQLKGDLLQRLKDLNARKTSLEREFADMPDKSTQFSKNQRFYKLYEEFYLGLMQSKSEFEIAQAGTTPDFKILSPATLPVNPISPKKMIITGIGLVASIIIILFAVGILYLLNNKVTSISELEKATDVPVLGVVPVSRYAQGNGLHVLEHPKSMVSEAIRTLRTNLDFFNAGAKQKVIAVSSTVSGEGKSFIAMNLGAVMALSKKKVILLDLDMRKPKMHLPAELDDKSKGVSTVLIRKNSWEECLQKTSLENFDYIPSGPHPPNPSELLLNGEFSGLLDDLRAIYDFIILDTPPVGLVTDGIMAMKHADVSIYVFRANYSKKDFTQNLRRIVSINKFSNITTLLNAMPSTGERSYGYGYYEEPSRQSALKSIFKR